MMDASHVKPLAYRRTSCPVEAAAASGRSEQRPHSPGRQDGPPDGVLDGSGAIQYLARPPPPETSHAII